MPHGKLTKKEISRYSKKELLKICREVGVSCNTKSSKSMLVAEVLKNKGLRSTLAVKGKRALTDKQKANLARFRFKKNPISNLESNSAVVNKPVPVASISVANPKSRVKVNPRGANKTAQPCNIKENVATELAKEKALAKATPKLPQPKKAGQDVKIVGSVKIMEEEFRDDMQKKKLVNTEYKFEKRTRDRASLNANKLHHQHSDAQDTARLGKSTSHTTTLLKRTNVNAKMIRTRNEEFGTTTTKTSDRLDRLLLSKRQEKADKQLEEADKLAKKDERDFDEEGEEEEPTEVEREREVKRLSKVQQLILLNEQLESQEITQEEFNTQVSEITKRTEQAQKDTTEPELALKSVVSTDQVNLKLLEVLTKLNDAIEKKKDSSE